MEYDAYLGTVEKGAVEKLEPTKEMLRQSEEAWRKQVEAERREVQQTYLSEDLGARAHFAAALA